ncbi:alpha-amylase family glycosyl hydrolase [Leuconostoc mesenteroides]|uniref:alpha-amylase family glycosyl hydrolase n=1 Tax=Leuconostoc mesenteroides TaxID=1245 RepID=UPI00235F6585|nr:alpha-amylase family glycosyl hydrolase [Leuconostoc mesenteroides]
MEKVQWWQNTVVYQIYPRSFQDSNGDGVGDIPGIIERLPYLKALGVQVIWLSPIYQSPNDDNGYDISDYRKVLPEFGTMADVQEMLEVAHHLGLKIMMDLVVNHTSDEHQWFKESRKNKDNPYRNYYIWRDPVDGHEPNNWLSDFGGSAWEFDNNTQQYYLHLFSKKQPDLNWDNLDLRQNIYDTMKWWLDQGVDGFRMDVINLISKPSDLPNDPNVTLENHGSSMDFVANVPNIHDYLQEMNQEVLSKHDIITVGETPGVSTKDAMKYAGFTESHPWLSVNPNYQTINVADSLTDQQSIFHFYQKLIALRQELSIITTGKYEVLHLEDESVYAYKRIDKDTQLLVISNFTDQKQTRHYDRTQSAQLVISNYSDDQGDTLRPYESKVYLF